MRQVGQATLVLAMKSHPHRHIMASQTDCVIITLLPDVLRNCGYCVTFILNYSVFTYSEMLSARSEPHDRHVDTSSKQYSPAEHALPQKLCRATA